MNFDYDLQTTPLQFMKNYNFESGSTKKVEIVLRQENNNDAIGKVRIIFSKPPKYNILNCNGETEFPSSFPTVPNKIWEIQRIKDDNNNKIVILYDGEKLEKDLSSCSYPGEEVKKIAFYSPNHPDFYRAKPGKSIRTQNFLRLNLKILSSNMPFPSNWPMVVAQDHNFKRTYSQMLYT